MNRFLDAAFSQLMGSKRSFLEDISTMKGGEYYIEDMVNVRAG